MNANTQYRYVAARSYHVPLQSLDTGFETVGDFMVQKLGLKGDEGISWGGACRRVRTCNIELGSKRSSKEGWEEGIKRETMGGDYDLALTAGSELEGAKVGAKWTIHNQFRGGKSLGDTATVWDAEVGGGGN